MIEIVKKVLLALTVVLLISCGSSSSENNSQADMSMEHEDSHEGGHDHGNSLDVSQLANPPIVTMSGTPGETGEVVLNFSIENLELIPVNPPSEHEAGQGHLHLHVDGVSVAMLDETSYTVNDLTQGLHSFRVTVSTNDHREYSVNGEIVSDSISLEIEDGEEAPTVDNQIVIEVKNETVTGGIQRMAVEVGDQVRVTVVSDVEDMFHLHAYDLELSLKAGQPETLQFQANIPGVFEGELHEAGYQIFALEVS